MRSVVYFILVNAIFLVVVKTATIYTFGNSLYDLTLLCIARHLSRRKLRLYQLVNLGIVGCSIGKTIARLMYVDGASGDLRPADYPFFAAVLGAVSLAAWSLRQTAFTLDQSSLHARDPRLAIRRLLRLVVAEKRLLTVACVCLVVAAVAGALVPHFLGAAVLPDAERGSAIGLLLGSASVAGLFGALRGSCFIILGARTARRLREDLLRSLLKKNIAFFDETATGELQSRLTLDVQKVADQIQFNVNYFSRNCLSMVVVLCFMFALCSTLAVLVCVCLPIPLVFSQVYGDFMKRLQRRIQDQQAQVATIAEEALRNVRTVRSFAAEDLEVARFRHALDHVYLLIKTSAKLFIPYVSGGALIPSLVTVLVILFGTDLVASGAIKSSVLVSFLLYLNMLTDNISAIGDIFANLVAALGAAEKVFLWLDSPSVSLAPPVLLQSASTPLLQDAPSAVSPSLVSLGATSLPSCLRLEAVVFRYRSSPTSVVAGVDLEVRPGQLVALTGESGSGKSSIFALLQRHYAPTSGRISLDGVDIERYPHDAQTGYEQTVSMVSQEPALFNRTVAENILLGWTQAGSLDLDVSGPLMAAVVRAATLANAHEFIEKLPQGYGTVLGPTKSGGVNLSGGQKQRLAIARALVRNPRFLLLDEATSALDSESEKAVQVAIERLTKFANVGVLLIAHRLSTVRNADLIHVMCKGQIVESGTHDLLILQADSLYARLVLSGGLDASLPAPQPTSLA